MSPVNDQPEPNPFAEQRQAAFRAIAGQSGGAKAMLLSPEVLQLADKALDEFAPTVMTDLERSARAMADLAVARQQAGTIFGLAHDIRGLAELCGRPAAGTIAGVIRAYRFGPDEAVAPDWNLLIQLTGLLALALAQPDQAPIAAVEEMCRAAVVKTMTREGRPLPDLPW